MTAERQHVRLRRHSPSWTQGSSREVTSRVLETTFRPQPARTSGFVFDTSTTGRQVEFELRGTTREILERELPAPQRGPRSTQARRRRAAENSSPPAHWRLLEEQTQESRARFAGSLEQAIESAVRRKQRARRAARGTAPLCFTAWRVIARITRGSGALYSPVTRRTSSSDARHAAGRSDIRTRVVRTSSTSPRSRARTPGTGDAAASQHDVHDRVWTSRRVCERGAQQLVPHRVTTEATARDFESAA